MNYLKLFFLIFFFSTFLFSASLKEVKLLSGHEEIPYNTLDVLELFQKNFSQKIASGENPYVGSEFCLACHNKNRFKETGHSHFIRRPLAEWSLVEDKGVIADYDKNGVDDFIQGLNFNEISSPFDNFKPNAPILGYSNNEYTITIGNLKMVVVFTLASQRYIVKIPTVDTETGYSYGNYFAPLVYNPSSGWASYSTSNWYDENYQPKYQAPLTSSQLANLQGANYNYTCAGCHITGIRGIEKTSAGEWKIRPNPAVLFTSNDPNYFDLDRDGIFDMVNIGCESCHGPGGLHIAGGGDKTKIINPDEYDTQLANDICGRCHSRPKSLPNKTFSWPYDDANMVDWYPGIGLPLSQFMVDNSTYWPDGETPKSSRPYTEFYKSSKPTFQFHPVRCYECHSVHYKSQEAQIRPNIKDGDLTIPTKVDDDTLCLACHATHGEFEAITKEMVANYEENKDAIGKVVEEHTHHPYAPERIMGLSRCTLCHMAEYPGHPSHTFKVVPPEKTLNYQDKGGMPNGCALSCHGTKVDIFGIGIDPNPSQWNDPFDVLLASHLQEYFGQDGKWWDTEE